MLRRHSPMKTLHDLVADKLEQADPAARAALLRIPLDNIDRWLAKGHTAPHRLEQWRQIILHAQLSPDEFLQLPALLRDSSEATTRLLAFAPFAGALTAGERLTVIRPCAYSQSVLSVRSLYCNTSESSRAAKISLTAPECARPRALQHKVVRRRGRNRARRTVQTLLRPRTGALRLGCG
jgi:hypothetical protein